MDDPKAKYATALMIVKEVVSRQKDRSQMVQERTYSLQTGYVLSSVSNAVTLGEWLDHAPYPDLSLKINFVTHEWTRSAVSWHALAVVAEDIEKMVDVAQDALKEEHLPVMYDSARAALADIHAAFHPVECAMHETESDHEIDPNIVQALASYTRSRDFLKRHGVIKSAYAQRTKDGLTIAAETIRFEHT